MFRGLTPKVYWRPWAWDAINLIDDSGLDPLIPTTRPSPRLTRKLLEQPARSRGVWNLASVGWNEMNLKGLSIWGMRTLFSLAPKLIFQQFPQWTAILFWLVASKMCQNGKGPESKRRTFWVKRCCFSPAGKTLYFGILGDELSTHSGRYPQKCSDPKTLSVDPTWDLDWTVNLEDLVEIDQVWDT